MLEAKHNKMTVDFCTELTKQNRQDLIKSPGLYVTSGEI